MTDTARVLIDGTFYIRCETAHVDGVIDQLELDDIEIDDVTWSTDQLGRTTVSLTTATAAPVFEFHVNLDERGEFYADVRAADGETVFEFRSDDDGNLALIEDGFMRHSKDIAGLETHLRSLGIIPADASIENA